MGAHSPQSDCPRIGANSDRDQGLYQRLPAARNARQPRHGSKGPERDPAQAHPCPPPCATREEDTQCHARGIPNSTLLRGGSG